MPFAAALSEHPLPAEAAGEVIGQILESLPAQSDLAVLFACLRLGGEGVLPNAHD